MRQRRGGEVQVKGKGCAKVQRLELAGKREHTVTLRRFLFCQPSLCWRPPIRKRGHDANLLYFKEGRVNFKFLRGALLFY